MSALTSREFWKATVERGVRTAAQVAGATLIADATTIIDTDWIGVFSVTGMAFLLSLLMSIGGGASGGGPALAGPEAVPGVEPKYAVTTDPE